MRRSSSFDKKIKSVNARLAEAITATFPAPFSRSLFDLITDLEMNIAVPLADIRKQLLLEEDSTISNTSSFFARTKLDLDQLMQRLEVERANENLARVIDEAAKAYKKKAPSVTAWENLRATVCTNNGRFHLNAYAEIQTLFSAHGHNINRKGFTDSMGPRIIKAAGFNPEQVQSNCAYQTLLVAHLIYPAVTNQGSQRRLSLSNELSFPEALEDQQRIEIYKAAQQLLVSSRASDTELIQIGEDPQTIKVNDITFERSAEKISAAIKLQAHNSQDRSLEKKSDTEVADRIRSEAQALILDQTYTDEEETDLNSHWFSNTKHKPKAKENAAHENNAAMDEIIDLATEGALHRVFSSNNLKKKSHTVTERVNAAWIELTSDNKKTGEILATSISLDPSKDYSNDLRTLLNKKNPDTDRILANALDTFIFKGEKKPGAEALRYLLNLKREHVIDLILTVGYTQLCTLQPSPKKENAASQAKQSY